DFDRPAGVQQQRGIRPGGPFDRFRGVERDTGIHDRFGNEERPLGYRNATPAAYQRASQVNRERKEINDSGVPAALGRRSFFPSSRGCSTRPGKILVLGTETLCSPPYLIYPL